MAIRNELNDLEVGLFHGALSTVNYLFLNFEEDSRYELLSEDIGHYVEMLDMFEGVYTENVMSIIKSELENLFIDDTETSEEILERFSAKLSATILDLTGREVKRVHDLYMQLAREIAESFQEQ